jgi:hypothetical protein
VKAVAVTIKYDREMGEGTVHVSPAFRQENALMRADVLKDALFDLKIKYNNAVKEAFAGFERVEKKKATRT